MAEARFATCAAAGRYDHVPAAERCSIGVAQGMGVFDDNAWYADPYAATTKTQSEDPNASASDVTRSSVMCNSATDPAFPHVAFPLCGVAVGVQSAREEAPDGSASCVTTDCPPGFAQEGDACVRPVVARSVAQKSRCDERWYDWFNVENAHLGNGVGPDGNSGACYAPCPAGFVPNVNVNPVDGALLSVTGADDATTCVPKSSFAFGVYSRTPDYAPLAWVHRLTARPEDFVRATEAAVDALSVGGGSVANGARDQASANATADSGALYTAMDATTDALMAAAIASGGVPVISSGTGYLSAGKTLNTPDRLNYAVAVCRQVHDNPAGFLKKWAPAWGARADARMALLRQACHLTCCDANSMASIGAQPICFDATTLSNSSPAAATKAAKAKAKVDAANKKRDAMLAEKGVGSPGELAFYSTMRPAVLLGVLPVLVVMLCLILGPLVLWLWRRFVTGWDPNMTASENSSATVDRAKIQSLWVTRFLEVLSQLKPVWGQLMGAFRWCASLVAWVFGGVAPVAVNAVGNVAGKVTDGLLKKTLAGLAIILVIVLVFAIIMFIYFYITIHDISIGGGGFQTFLNAFNYHDWQFFNWNGNWLVRMTNEFLNPYRKMTSSDAVPRPPLAPGRCDNVTWVNNGSGTCNSSLLPAPIVWPLSFSEGSLVPNVLRASAPTSVSIPYVATGDTFAASCDVSVPGPDGTPIPLLVPAPGDDTSCVRVRTALPAFVDTYRPKRGSTGWEGLAGYADATKPRC